MFDTLSIAQLEKLLDEFTVPMFLVERQDHSGDFKITALNRAFEDQSGLSRQSFLGESPVKFVGEAAEAETFENYLQCVETGQTIRFTSVLSFSQEAIYWEKTLQHSPGPDGRDRVIVTAIKLPDVQPLLQDRLAFEDLSYFSSLVDLQVQNLSSAFDTATQEAQVSVFDEERITRLHASCRTIQRTVSDIKKIVRNAQASHTPSSVKAAANETIKNNGFVSDQGFSIAQALTDPNTDHIQKTG